MRLSDPISSVKYINEIYAKKLHKLGIFSISDLITYFPRKYSDAKKILTISELIKDFSNIDLKADVIIYGQVQNFKNTRLRSGKSIQTGFIKDKETNSKVKIIFFNQPFLTKVIKDEDLITLTGKIKKTGNSITIISKKFDKFDPNNEKSIHIGTIVPEYNLTKGISAKWLRNRIDFVLNNIDQSEFKQDLTIKYLENFLKIDILSLIKECHFGGEEESISKSVEHLSYLELVHLSLKTISNRIHLLKKRSVFLNNIKESLEKALKLLPFELTKSQKVSISDAVKVIKSDEQANILLQGDVGSGKTAVAFILGLLYAFNGLKVVYLAPTTILSEQVFEFFQKLLFKTKIKVGLQNSGSKINHEEFQILIGTTSLLTNTHLKNVGLLIVDEQHKFGVQQRELLLKTQTQNAIDFLSMTATPIPRTIAEGLFGNLEVISLSQKPGSRKRIKTFIVYKEKKLAFQDWINQRLNEGNQIFWVCPNIESTSEIRISAKEKYKEILETYPNFRSELIHGKLKSNDKQGIINRFRNCETSILVTTSLIEVGIDIPSASIMIIENPEAFGLASLHQIRGRVGRNDNENFCFLIPGDNISDRAKERIDFFARHHDGIKIAEFDLKSRGPGEVYGKEQSGIPKLKIAKFDDIDRIRKAMIDAKKLYEEFKLKKIHLFE